MESVSQISSESVNEILSLAKLYKERNTNNESLKGKIIALIFFEPSTRTSLSFECAIDRLGAKCIKYNMENSSTLKGENILDTIKTIEYYADVLIIRHSDVDIFSKIRNIIKKPIINAGNGMGEHPSQSLLDLFTILTYYPEYPNNVAFVGGINYCRTVNSLILLLQKMTHKMNFYFICNDKNSLLSTNQIDFYKKDIEKSNKINYQFNYYNIDNIDDKCPDNIDVLYVTRLQKERFNYDIDKNSIIVNSNFIKNTKKNMIILHPFPRNQELSKDLDNNVKSKYFEQIENGIYVRMAILTILFN